MNLARRTFLQFAGAAVTVPVFSRFAVAQGYPTRPITMIVPQAAGSTLDVIGRVLAERLKGSLGQPIIIENISGADGNIGVDRAARARPDGYTMNVSSISQHVLNAALYSLQYDVVNDFAPVSPLTTSPFVLYARITMPARDLNELISWLKANPNKASAGILGASIRLIAAFFQKESGTQFTLVPYRGLPFQDLVAGQIDLSFGTPVSLSLARAGSVKAYAVTSETRLTIASDIPTFSEMGLPALSFSAWSGLFAPKGNPSFRRPGNAASLLSRQSLRLTVGLSIW
jgi:tripartite-type tricarboxylate transporter receptor subunit TctC